MKTKEDFVFIILLKNKSQTVKAKFVYHFSYSPVPCARRGKKIDDELVELLLLKSF